MTENTLTNQLPGSNVNFAIALFNGTQQIGWLGAYAGDVSTYALVVTDIPDALIFQCTNSGTAASPVCQFQYQNTAEAETYYMYDAGASDNDAIYFDSTQGEGFTYADGVLTSVLSGQPLSFMQLQTPITEQYYDALYANTGVDYTSLTVQFLLCSSVNPSPQSPIEHVFVVMLENRSFDNILGNSGFQAPITANSNSYNNVRYPVTGSAPTTLTTDPGHELPDVLQQLTNIGPNWFPPLGPYPRSQMPADFANGTGFAASYATNVDEDNTGPAFPASANIGDTMKFFDPGQLPVLNALANEFAVCTNWFSSLPGPTWPNRFFLHCASSNGMDCSPTTSQIDEWIHTFSIFDLPGGFTTPNGSIFKARTSPTNFNYKIYNDCDASTNNSDFSDNPTLSGGEDGFGWVPQVASLSDIVYDSWSGLKASFENDLAAGNVSQYTFIEPHYGDIAGNTYKGGSSQHPMDDVYGGENLVKFVYETLKSSPVWKNSLLIIIYDEHGGFYDSVPPPYAPPPNDGAPAFGAQNSLNRFGFEFDQYGVRVPAIVVSPYINKGTIDTNLYDHTSVLATLETLFNLPPLTDRDKNARNVLGVLTDTYRTDCPEKLPDPVQSVQEPGAALTGEEITKANNEPLPQSGNLIGTMGILLKMHLEMSAAEEHPFIRANFETIKTKGQLKEYAALVAQKRQSKLAGESK